MFVTPESQAQRQRLITVLNNAENLGIRDLLDAVGATFNVEAYDTVEGRRWREKPFEAWNEELLPLGAYVEQTCDKCRETGLVPFQKRPVQIPGARGSEPGRLVFTGHILQRSYPSKLILTIGDAAKDHVLVEDIKVGTKSVFAGWGSSPVAGQLAGRLFMDPKTSPLFRSIEAVPGQAVTVTLYNHGPAALCEAVIAVRS